MSLPNDGWSNKAGTGDRSCRCGTWKLHWIHYSGAPHWPLICSVDGCGNSASVGAHIRHPGVSGEQIVPMCISCNGRGGLLRFKAGTYVASANQSETCQ